LEGQVISWLSWWGPRSDAEQPRNCQHRDGEGISQRYSGLRETSSRILSRKQIEQVRMAATRTRDPYVFQNHDVLPPIPRDMLAQVLKGWDDSSDQTDAYLNCFTDDAVLLFGAELKGKDAIRAARNGMIHKDNGPVKKCTHYFETGFATGGGMSIDGKWEIAGIADIKYELVDGTDVWTRATSWCRVTKDGSGRWLIDKYEVFMDGSKLFAAMGNLGK
jgi:ketosteroid isomerase-like protein